MKKTNLGKQFWAYAQNTFWHFITHLKPDKKIVLSAIYDTIFWLVFFSLSYLASLALKKEASFLTAVNTHNQAAQALVQANTKLMQAFLIKISIYLLIYFVLIILAYSLMKGVLWYMLFNKNFGKKQFATFFKLNLIWFVLWLIPIVFTLLATDQTIRNTLIIIEFFLYLHLTTVLHASFVPKENIKHAFTTLFEKSILNIHHFILPYLFSLALYLLLTRLLLLIPQHYYGTTLVITSMLIALLFLAWFRNYLKDVVLQIKETHRQ